MPPSWIYLSGWFPTDEDGVARRSAAYWIDDGKLWTMLKATNLPVEVLPIREGIILAKTHHDVYGHFGRDLCLRGLMKHYVWAKMRHHIDEAIKNCDRCLRFGPKLTKSLLRSVTRYLTFDTIAFDYLSMPEAEGGQTTVLVAIDIYSKFIWAWTYDHPGTAETTISAFEDLRRRYTLPRCIYVDNGSAFINQDVTRYLERHRIETEKSSPYDHVGVVENAHHLILDRLRHLVYVPSTAHAPAIHGTRTWPDKIQDGVALLNDRVINHLASYTPREVLFGIPPTKAAALPPDLQDLERERQLRSIDIETFSKTQLDPIPSKFKAGDMVLRYDGTLDNTHSMGRKLKIKWQGPFVITDVTRGSARLQQPDGTPVRNKTSLQRLKAYRGWQS